MKKLVISILVLVVIGIGFYYGYQQSYQTPKEKIEAKKKVLRDTADNLFDAKQYTKAINAYQAVYEYYSENDDKRGALMMIGLCYDSMKQSDKAIATYEGAIRDYPPTKGSPAIYFYLGWQYHQTGQKEKALAALNKCIELCPDDSDPNRFPMKDARSMVTKLEKEK